MITFCRVRPATSVSEAWASARRRQGTTTVELESVTPQDVAAALQAGLLPVALGLSDDSVAPERCPEGAGILSIDGGPELCVPGDLPGWDASGHVVTVRAFVVNGRAPDELADLNHDGVIDVADALRAGLEVLSEQAEVRFVQFHELPVFHGFDFDGDGLAAGPVLPAAPGDLTPPPR